MPKAGIANKVKEHNARSKHKVTTSMLEAVYRRGIGAYKTNPGSVRPNVKSPEQWAMARVNSFLRIVSGSKSPKHDKDLLPASHASSSKKSDEEVTKAEYQGEQVTLNKPRRIKGGNKKFEVFVQSGGKVKRVAFGDPNMEIRRDDPKARANFRARHNCDSKKDKTTAGYWSCRMWEGGTSVSQITKHNIEGQILKADDEQRLVYGWASVVTEKGEPVVDRQGDVIEPETLVKAVNNFMENIRVGKEMHKGDQIGAVIHSMPVTKEIGESLGIQSDREGWVVAFKVYDDDVWARVKSGELAAFSIGGRAIKESYDA
tara:strand:+ start:1026 stop:1973 length:948 start_codon:yes stop_codon:yes gene_type:complete